MILPVVATTAIVLAALRWWQGLAAWVIAVGGVLGTILALKLVFGGCDALAAATGIRSPSGHTSSAAVVYGGLLVLFTRGRAKPWVAAVLSLAVTVVIGATRLILHLHTPIDVVIGSAIGLAGVLLLTRLAGVWQRPAWPLAAAVIVVALLFHGLNLPAESMIRHVIRLGWMSAACGTLPLPG